MKTAICTNEICPENGVNEFMCGDPDYVMCGVCQEPCDLSELYDDLESCNAPMGSNPEA